MDKLKSLITPVLLVVFVILVWKYSWYYVDSEITEPTLRGVFGDQFGFVNSLFSGLAFAGVIYAILLQRSELKLQREELKMTRRELEGQKLQLEAQNNTFREQTLQNAFFQMLSFHNEIVKGIVYIDKGHAQQRFEGRDCFGKFYNELCRVPVSEGISDKQLKDQEYMGQRYSNFYLNYQDDLGHYFRNLYNIIKFIHTNDFKNKKYYTNLVRAQLSVYEIILLLYNCEFGLGRKKFKQLVERYSLLKTLDEDLLIYNKHKDLYEESAYQ